METDEKQKPDGWVAVLNGRLFLHCVTVYASWLDCCIASDINGSIFEPSDSREVIAAKMADAGWEIRPVKLVFLDEEK